MSRTQISLPEKSKLLRMPVPVITYTFLPSVTGEGDDIFCLRIFTLPLPSNFFQSTSPLVLSRHQRNRLSPSATFRKIRSRQIIGVEPLQPGIATFQAMFSSVVHLTGRFFSALTPLSAGPRHCGQLSAETMFSEAAVERAIMTNMSVNRRRMSFLRKLLGTHRFQRAGFIISDIGQCLR